MLGDLPPHPAHPASGVGRVRVDRLHHFLFHPVDVVRVDEVGLLELDGGPGELAEHQGAAVVDPGGDVLLGDQVHPVAQRGHQHDVGCPVEGGEFLATERLMQVVHGRLTDVPVVAVDPPHLQLDLVPKHFVVLDPLAAGRRDLDQHRVGDLDRFVLQQLLKGLQAHPDALCVIEPVDAQQDRARVAQLDADLAGALGDPFLAGYRVDAGEVDRDRERPGPDRPALELHLGAARFEVEQPAGQPQEVRRTAGQLEADQVGAEQAPDHLGAPGQLHEQLLGRKRDVQEKANTQIRTPFAKHLRDQLELVVLDPDHRALGRRVGGDIGEPSVDRDVRIPPAPMVFRLGDHVVVERPERRVGEALVVGVDLAGRERHRPDVDPIGLERLRRLTRRPRPADPDAVPTSHHRFERGDQAAGAGPPAHGSVGSDLPVYGQPVGDDDERAPVRHGWDPLELAVQASSYRA